MALIVEGGSPVNLTSSGAVSNVPGILLGFYVNSTSSGTVVLRNGGSAGTAISGTITPAVGFHRFPAAVGTSCYATIGATLDATFFFQPA
jgi:hypothetical protein